MQRAIFWRTLASSATGAGIATTGSSAYTDTAVTAGTTYTYSVTAIDSSGNESGPSNEASATPTDDTTPPAAPTALTAEGGDAQVALDWADNAESDVAGYRVYRDGASPSRLRARTPTRAWRTGSRTPTA